MCWLGCVLQDAAGLSEATGPVELLQREKSTASDLLGCVYDLLECRPLSCSSAGAVIQDALDGAPIGQQWLLLHVVLFKDPQKVEPLLCLLN